MADSIDKGVVLERAESVPAGQKLPICVSGTTYNVEGLGTNDVGNLPASWSYVGRRYPVVTKEVHPGETVQAEPGAMLSMGNNISMSTAFAGIKATFGGDLIKTKFKNTGKEPQTVSLAGSMPFGVLVPLVMAEHGGKFIAMPGAYFASDAGISISAKLLRAQSCAACCCGGMSPIVQTIKGDGTAFILGSGTVAKKTLAAGEKLLVSTGTLVGFSDSVKFDVKKTGSCATCCFGGEGCFNTQVEGPGVAYVQSFGLDKLAKLMPPKGGKGSGGDGGGGGGDGGAPAEPGVMDR